jgi:hypothetical protein
VTIVIIAECQSQDNNDYVSTKETVIEPTEVVETSVPKKETIVKNNDTNIPKSNKKNRRKIEKLIPYTNVHDHSNSLVWYKHLRKKVTGLN